MSSFECGRQAGSFGVSGGWNFLQKHRLHLHLNQAHQTFVWYDDRMIRVPHCAPPPRGRNRLLYCEGGFRLPNLCMVRAAQNETAKVERIRNGVRDLFGKEIDISYDLRGFLIIKNWR